MKQISVFAVILSAMLIFAGLNICADEMQEIIDQLDSIIPDEVQGEIEISENEVLPSFGDIINLCINTVVEKVRAPAQTLSALLFIISVGGVFKVCTGMIGNERLHYVFEFSCRVSMALSMFTVCYVSIESARSFLMRLCDFSLALSPIMTALCITSGTPGAATVTGVGISIFVAVCEVLFATFLISLTRMIFALSVCSTLGENMPDLTGITKLAKRIFSLLTGFTVMLFCAVSTYQSIIFSGSDSITFRTVRFAVGNVVPVVGASLGEALRVVIGAISTLRGTVGGVGVCVIFLLLIPTAISILLNIGVISIASSVSRMFGLANECRFLDEIMSIYGHLLALTVSASFMMIFLLSVVSAIPINIGGV